MAKQKTNSSSSKMVHTSNSSPSSTTTPKSARGIGGEHDHPPTQNTSTAPNRRSNYRDKPFGVVDFALTNLDFPALTARLAQTGTGISYDPPKAGGRTKPDGTQLEWEVTFPTGTERGSVPFWCEDVTPRERRVPVTDASTRHPSGVLGMGGVSVEVEGAKVEGLGRALGAICESGGKGGKGSDWEVGVPREVEGARKPVISLKDGGGEEVKLTLVLQGAERSGVEAIRERIGEGIVAIDFV